MPERYEKDMNVLMKAAAEVKVSTKKLKRYTFINYVVLDKIQFCYLLSRLLVLLFMM